jgi:hypothetical protein
MLLIFQEHVRKNLHYSKGVRIVSSVRYYDPGWMTRNCCSVPSWGKSLFTSPKHTDEKWIPSSLIFNVQLGLLPLGLSGSGVTPTTHHCLVLTIRINGTTLPLPHIDSQCTEQQPCLPYTALMSNVHV